MVATISLLDKPSRECRDDPARRSRTAPDDEWAGRLEAATPACRSAATVVCPACHKKLRWRNRWPGRAVCPACGLRLVVLWDDLGRFSAHAESEGAVADMICNWLDGGNGEEEDDR